ncbi:hypothetical protein GCM10010472_69360 [Pseudonocardia halophobica]|uniref:Uncharacterized protein n=1 Tax=Pseudonocardia halophobica TaxID=29401 RepID=A0A9W6UE54_9PSEU|nr:hypothetical protein GCM10017577_69990 [Pseudonocardia halophobica]
MAQRRSPQHRLDLLGAGLDVPTTGPPQDPDDLRPGQPGRPVRIQGPLQQFQRVRIGQLELPRRKRVQGAGEVLAQRRPQPLQMPGPIPDQRLTGPRDHLQPLHLRAVPGDRTVVVPVEAHDLGQHVRVPGIGLRPRGGVPLPITRHRHRVDREHLVAGRDQRGDPRAAVGLDPDHHRPGRGHPGLRVDRVVIEVLGEQLVQPGHPGHALGQPGPAQPFPGLVEDLHIVVVLGPVIAHEQRHHCLSRPP